MAKTKGKPDAGSEETEKSERGRGNAVCVRAGATERAAARRTNGGFDAARDTAPDSQRSSRTKAS